MPAKKTEDKYAPTTWNNEGEDLECPSGQLCLVRRPGLTKLMNDGLLDKIDILTTLVDQTHVKKKSAAARKQQAMQIDMETKKALKDPEKIKDWMAAVDKVVLATVIKPEISPTPANEIDRKPDQIYVDQIEVDDKMYIFSFAVGGTRDAERFRKQLAESIDSLVDVQAVENPAE